MTPSKREQNFSTFLNYIVNQFWNRWAKEHLQELQNAHHYPNKKQQSSLVQEGDMVVVQDPDLPRGFWKLAKVMRLLTGHNGHHRGTVLRVAARGGQATTLQQPLQFLYSLEINCGLDQGDKVETATHEATKQTDDTPTENCDQDNSTVYDEQSVTTERSPKRLSALKAQE